ncbi:MAG TPA: hypothetical protein VMU25_01245 [Candidatus Paceibacterota bacterium]|nr:hypothetical protein [Candidatus Paceibacterota bacterium]
MNNAVSQKEAAAKDLRKNSKRLKSRRYITLQTRLEQSLYYAVAEEAKKQGMPMSKCLDLAVRSWMKLENIGFPKQNKADLFEFQNGGTKPQ